MWSRLTRQLIDIACEEDLGAAGDITAPLLPQATADVVARVAVRQAGVICGLALGPVVCEAFAQRLGQPLQFSAAERDGQAWQDGAAVAAGACVATVRGPLAAVLAAERTLLNFLGRLSGVATLTRQYVEAAQQVAPTVKILDTRKTVPGWRQLDKYAVRVAGGHNHRIGLYDAVLIKDNHLAGIPVARLAATLEEQLGRITNTPAFIEVEVDTLEQLAEVCRVPDVDIVLLDNFTLEQLRAAVALRDAHSLRGKLALEASGGITLETVAQVAATGVERISVGALTHSAPGLDIGLDM